MGTLLCLKEPVWVSGRVFVLDSSFCVLQAIVELQKKGLFAVALIKKHCCWPKYIPGDNVVSHFAEKGISESDALQGMIDNVKFHVVAMKEPDYVMMFMTTFGILAPFGEEKRHYLVNGVKHVETFQYLEVVHNHYQYRDVMDNHNSARMHPISMEEIWMTMCWPNCVLFFCWL